MHTYVHKKATLKIKKIKERRRRSFDLASFNFSPHDQNVNSLLGARLVIILHTNISILCRYIDLKN